jgi:hypothetical protein
LAGGTLQSKFFTGKGESQVATSVSTEYLEIDDIYGLSVSYDKNDWTIQARHTQVSIANENNISLQILEGIKILPAFVWPDNIDISESLLLKNKHAVYNSVSGQTFFKNYIFTAELAQINSNDTNIISKLVSGYVGLAHQRNDHTFYGVYAFTKADKFTFNEIGVQTAFIPEIVQGIEDINNFYASNQRTFSLGWRWDYSANIAMSLQWNNTHIEDGGGTLWINKTNDTSAKTVNTLMLNVSFSL